MNNSRHITVKFNIPTCCDCIITFNQRDNFLQCNPRQARLVLITKNLQKVSSAPLCTCWERMELVPDALINALKVLAIFPFPALCSFAAAAPALVLSGVQQDAQAQQEWFQVLVYIAQVLQVLCGFLLFLL